MRIYSKFPFDNENCLQQYVINCRQRFGKDFSLEWLIVHSFLSINY